MSWVDRFLDVGWAPGADGPEAYTCWNHFRWVQRTQFGRRLPPVLLDAADARTRAAAFAHSPLRAAWQPVGAADGVTGDAVLCYRRAAAGHIGTLVRTAQGVHLLHCARGLGAQLTPLDRLPALGWRRIEVFAYRGRHACTH